MAMKLRLRGPANRNVEWGDIPPTSTMNDLQQLALAEFQIEPPQQKLMIGFPPKELTFDTSDLVSSKLSSNEMVIVQIRPQTGDPAAPVENLQGSSRPKRKRESQTTKPPPSSSGGGVHTLSSLPKPKRTQAAVAEAIEDEDHFDDDFDINAPEPQKPAKRVGRSRGGPKRSAPPRPKRQKTSEASIEALPIPADPMGLQAAQDGLGVAFVEAISASSMTGADLAQDYLKKAAQLGLKSRQEESLAQKRYEASLSGDYEITVPDLSHLGGEYQQVMKVKFKNGPRTWIEEVHHLFTPFELKAMIAMILMDGSGADNLKPYKSALVSPRLFWSMVHHFQELGSGLQQLFPQLDWSFLKNRRRTLSARAIENEANQALYDQLDKELAEQGEEDKMDVADDEEYTDNGVVISTGASEAATTTTSTSAALEATTTTTTTTVTTGEVKQVEEEKERPAEAESEERPWLKEPPLMLTWY